MTWSPSSQMRLSIIFLGKYLIPSFVDTLPVGILLCNNFLGNSPFQICHSQQVSLVCSLSLHSLGGLLIILYEWTKGPFQAYHYDLTLEKGGTFCLWEDALWPRRSTLWLRGLGNLSWLNGGTLWLLAYKSQESFSKFMYVIHIYI